MVMCLLLWMAAGAVTVKFNENAATFQNPGKGWMCGASAREPRFPCSVVYTRFNWGDIEPEEGRYNWSLLDTPIAAAHSRGARVAFRVMTANAHTRGYYCSPKWLFDAGCRWFEYLRGGEDRASGGARIPRIEPDYSDPMYLARHGAFIRELGKRYDGHAGVEFLDIGSYGIWGEWHTSHPAAWEVRRRIIDLYLEAFRRTPLAMMSDDAEAMAYALPRGTGYRRDGVGSPSHEQRWIGSEKYKDVPGFAEAWKRAPAIFEWFGNYDYLLARKWSFDRAVRFMLDNHVTLINDNVGRVPAEEMPKLMELARRSGYRFALREVSHQGRARRGGRLEVRMRWANLGVGRLYRGYPLELYLLDERGDVAARTRGVSDARQWLPGEHECREAVEVPAKLKAGDYSLAVALVDGDGRPAIALAMEAPEIRRRYRVSTVRVE